MEKETLPGNSGSVFSSFSRFAWSNEAIAQRLAAKNWTASEHLGRMPQLFSNDKRVTKQDKENRSDMKIAVYCGSSLGNEPQIIEAAARLGRWIASQGHSLIFGGGDSGLMGVVAKAVYEGGGETIGVMPGNVDFIVNRPQPFSTQTIITEDMSSRKHAMLEMADAFIALPGGLGTLDEISEVMVLTAIGVFHKPCVLFNAGGYYEPFRQMMLTMREKTFMPEWQIGLYLFSDDVDEINTYLEKF